MLCVCTRLQHIYPVQHYLLYINFFSSLEFWAGGKNGQEGGEEAVGSRRPTKSQWRWRRGLSPHLPSPASGKAYARDSSALFLHARGPGDHPLCFFSSSTLEEVGSGILQHSWFLWEAVGLCIFAASDTYSNVSFRTKDPQEGALIYSSLLAMHEPWSYLI